MLCLVTGVFSSFLFYLFIFSMQLIEKSFIKVIVFSTKLNDDKLKSDPEFYYYNCSYSGTFKISLTKKVITEAGRLTAKELMKIIIINLTKILCAKIVDKIFLISNFTF